MYREIEGEDVILEKDPTYTLTEDGAPPFESPPLKRLGTCLAPPPPLFFHTPNFAHPQRHVADIEQYASWLGMDLELDSHLFWIARAGLMTELPEDWKPCKSPDGEVYYFNFASGESQWDHPCDEEFRELYREQRQASILAAQQRLAWAACVWATGHVLPSSGGEVAAGRERERRVAAAKKRRRKAQNDTGGRRAHFAVARPAANPALEAAGAVTSGAPAATTPTRRPEPARTPRERCDAEPLIVEDLEPEPEPETDQQAASGGVAIAGVSPEPGSEPGKNSSPASPVKDVEDSESAEDLTPHKGGGSGSLNGNGKGESNTSPPKERSTSPLSVPNSPGSDTGNGAGKLDGAGASSAEPAAEAAC